MNFDFTLSDFTFFILFFLKPFKSFGLLYVLIRLALIITFK